ncbi:hypothetical protein Tco_1471920 [Tanacetum coccineum]
MQQFWFIISKIKDSSSYQFKLDKKKCIIDVEVFRDILHICPRLPNQEFDEPPFDEEIISFIDNRVSSAKRKENMPYPRFTKAIIQHFVSKDKSIAVRNRMFMHTVRDDSVLGTLKFVAKRATTPKKARKWKKPASPLKKQTLVITEEPAKKLAAKR